MSNRLREFWREECGSALLEGAIVIPFLFALVLGTLEFSNFYFQQHLVATGVRDAARYLARVPDSSDSTAQSNARNLASTGSIAGGSARRVTGFNPGDVTISFTSVANALDTTTHLRPYREADNVCGGPDQIRMIHAVGSFGYTSLGFLGFLGLSFPSITVDHVERCIGPG
jgi:Flp pilus assembly protein TadG